MTEDSGRRVAAALTLLTCTVVVADLGLRLAEPAARASKDALTLVPLILALAAVGGFVAARRASNLYGWILAVVALLLALNSLSIDYAAAALAKAHPGARAATVLAAITASLWWGTFVTFVLLLYPTGTLPSRRWRWAGWIAGAGVILMTIGLTWTAMLTAPAAVVQRFQQGLPVQESGIPEAINAVGHSGVFFGMLAGVVGLIVRRRRADAIERLQLKWFAFGAALVALCILGGFFFDGAAWLEIAAVTAMPVFIGIAILRWHLYDIDRIVSRAVAYALLSALLIGIYLAAVTALTRVTAPVTGDSPVAVAAATLLAAAAFQPARRKIQSQVDQRFNRARYDARRTLETFATSLRQEVELDDVRTSLVGTIGEVLQPASVTVWLRGGGMNA